MHIVESFALNSGSKIDKPYIYDSYVPLQWSTDRYITFQPFGTAAFESRKYSYWEEVFDILRPIFNKENIHIVQIGASGEPQIKGTMGMMGKTTLNQSAYLIKNAMLHLGIDSFGVHVASGYQKKIVALYSNMIPENSGPYWSKGKDVKLISSLKDNECPSYALQEDPKTIDRIKPEKIAKAVCDLLSIEYAYEFETVYTGKQYAQKRIEVVPTNHIGNWKDFGVDSLILRMDKHFNESVCASQLEKCACSLVTDKPIRLDLIKYFKKSISELVFIINDSSHIDYLHSLKATGVNMFLMSHLDDESFNKLKLDYIDVASILNVPLMTKDKFLKDHNDIDFNNLYFKSGVTVIRDKAIYGTYSPEEKTPMNYNEGFKPLKFLDCQELWSDLDRLLILKKKTS